MPIAIDAESWLTIFTTVPVIVEDADLKVILEQYEQVANKSAPSIADQRIKSIPIIECGEQLIDIRAVSHSRISMLADGSSNKSFEAPHLNSGLPNASKIRADVYHRLEKMVAYLDLYAELFGYEPGEISIKVFEGLRDLATQTQLFQAKVQEIQLAYPQYTAAQAENEAAKWVSPVKNNVPVHSTGAAVDIRLWNERTHDFVDLGKFGVIWGENQQAPTFSENSTDTQKFNRLYLLMAATKAGLVNYTYEYWHFSCGDRYAVYWKDKEIDTRVARYGSLQ